MVIILTGLILNIIFLVLLKENGKVNVEIFYITVNIWLAAFALKLNEEK
jgi:hypothetical protein